jgi:hypothetical protein
MDNRKMKKRQPLNPLPPRMGGGRMDADRLFSRIGSGATPEWLQSPATDNVPRLAKWFFLNLNLTPLTQN